VAEIYHGRTWLDTDGWEHDGRVNYRNGLANAMTAFQEAALNVTADLETLILAEYTFLTQELDFCDPNDSQAFASLSQAVSSFNDAFRALGAVGNSVVYSGAELTHPLHPKYRVQDMPKDAFHIACISHRTRIQNILRAPGINMAEKNLLVQRSANLTVAQTAYLEKQKATLNTAPVQGAAQ
jgi:hypothetical protein